MSELNNLITEIKAYFVGESERKRFIDKTLLALPDNPSNQGISPRQIKLYGSQSQIQLYDWLNKYNNTLSELLQLIDEQINNILAGSVYRLYINFQFTFDYDEWGDSTISGTSTPEQIAQISQFYQYENPKILYVCINGVNYLSSDLAYLSETKEYLISCIGLSNIGKVQSASIRIDADTNSSTYSLITGYHIKELYKTQIQSLKSEIETIKNRIENECIKYTDISQDSEDGIITITLKGE